MYRRRGAQDRTDWKGRSVPGKGTKKGVDCAKMEGRRGLEKGLNVRCARIWGEPRSRRGH